MTGNAKLVFGKRDGNFSLPRLVPNGSCYADNHSYSGISAGLCSKMASASAHCSPTGTSECQGQHLACQVPEVPVQCLNHRCCNALVNILLCVKVVEECEVIPPGIYCCVAGQQPRCVDMCNEVGKFHYARNVKRQWAAILMWHQGSVIPQTCNRVTS